MKHNQLQAAYPEWQLVFLDQKWDAALVGVAVRANTPPVPAYSWTACTQLLQPGETIGALSELFTASVAPRPLILMPVHRDDFWAAVGRHELILWEQAHPAITALGRRGAEPPVAVYSYPELLECLSAAVEPSTEELELAHDIFEANILPTWLGPLTPFILYPLAVIEA